MSASTTSTQLEHANALELAAGAGRPAGPAALGAGRWLLPAAEQYAAAQAAPHTARTYRSTLRSFALYVQSELGLPPRTDALTLATILDYKRHLPGRRPGDRPAAGRRARRSPSSSPPCAASLARWRSTTSSPTSTRASSSSRPAAATRHCHAR